MDIKIIENYVPINEQELRDKEQMLEAYERIGDDLFERHPVAHFTAASMILNKEHTKVLFQFHKIYQAWCWSGGHNDGDENFFSVAYREAKEECGLEELDVISEYPLSLDTLWVQPHIKRGTYVSGHLHFNLAYLFECDESSTIRAKEDEIDGLKWIDLKDLKSVSEAEIYPIYCKMLERLGIKHD